MITGEQLVRAFWAAFHAAAFDIADGMMSPDAVVTWPCTGEIFRGRNNFIAVQRHYPGRWRIAVEKILMAAECVVSIVKVTAEAGPGPSFHATSFFEFDAAEKIVAIAEYWATDRSAMFAGELNHGFEHFSQCATVVRRWPGSIVDG